jgi:hypothetical protein
VGRGADAVAVARRALAKLLGGEHERARAELTAIAQRAPYR